MKTSEVTRELKKGGCYIIEHKHRHDLWYSPITGNTILVGRHGAQEIPSGTANAILKRAGLK